MAVRISIVLPTLNAERYLAATLASLADETATLPAGAVEVLVVDGGSTDATEPIVRASGVPVRWISAPGLNQAAAINHGLDAGSGDICAWLNADDLLWPGALRAVLDVFDAEPGLDFVHGHAVAIDGRDRAFGPRRHVRSVRNWEHLLHEDVIVQPAAFWSRRLWNSTGPLRADLEYVFDYEFFLRVAACTRMRYIPVPLAAERLHADRKTSTGMIARVEELRQLLAEQSGTADRLGSFTAEVTATYLRAALDECRHRRFGAARNLLTQLPRRRREPFSAALRVACSLPAGERSFLRVLLWVNAASALRHGRRLRPGRAAAPPSLFLPTVSVGWASTLPVVTSGLWSSGTECSPSVVTEGPKRVVDLKRVAESAEAT